MTNPFKSKRVRDLPPPDEPSNFAVVGGWGTAHEAAGVERDAYESEREQRVAGAVALAELAERDSDRKQAAFDERLRGVQRGHDYRRPT